MEFLTKDNVGVSPSARRNFKEFIVVEQEFLSPGEIYRPFSQNVCSIVMKT